MQTFQEMTALARGFLEREKMMTECLDRGQPIGAILLEQHNKEVRELAIIALNLIRQMQLTATLSIPISELI